MKQDHNRAWALRLAEAGISVFPCNANPESEYFKKPATKDWDGNSSCDPARVAQMWAERPGALPAIDLGKSSLTVLDGDRHHDGIDGKAALRDLLRQAHADPRRSPCAATPHDGVHVYFRQNGRRLRNSQGGFGNILPKGIDVRGDGGYVIAPYAAPTSGERYRAVPNTPDLITAFTAGTIPPIPDAIIDLATTKPERQTNNNKPHETNKQRGSDRERAYAAVALKNLTDELAATGKGGRNAALNTAALKMGHLVARGWINRSEVEQALIGAMEANGYIADDGMQAAISTLRSGLDAGLTEPHEDLPDRPREPRSSASISSGTADGDARPSGDGVSLDDFYAYMLANGFIFAPTGEIWPATSVNARLQAPDEKISASKWLAQNRPVEQMTWAPGKPKLIKDSLISSGGWITRPGCTVFNLYRPPRIVPQAGDVTPWLDLIKKAFPDQAKHIVSFLAHRVQRPGEKINHALALGGEPGIGKDTILEPVKQAIGPWNFSDVSPKQVLGRFNSFLRSVILRINEARDLGDFDRYIFYDHMKVIIASPPDVLLVDEKHVHEHYIPNLCSVIITTNHKTDGIYLPADDRRHMVAWSNLTRTNFESDYWQKLYGWYADGGTERVAAYLANLDLSGFDPKAPPPKTQAFWEIANANRAPEDSELADVLDDLGHPDAVTLDQVASRATLVQPTFGEWLRERKNRRYIPHRFEDCRYVAVANPHDTEGRWKISGVRHTIYGKASLTVRDRLAAAMKLAGAR